MSDYDYGFSFESDEPVNDKDPMLMDLIAEHKTLITNEVRSKLKEIEHLIIPLLTNLQKNEDKAYIHWPNRVPVIQKQIDRILSITRYYEVNETDEAKNG